MQVQDLARELGVTTDTVRYYSRVGLLEPAKNPDNGYKVFGEQDRHRMRFILSARQLGFSVTDIRQILQHANVSWTVVSVICWPSVMHRLHMYPSTISSCT